jgi:hypothetical protein
MLVANSSAASLWMQVVSVPPGTNNTSRTETVPPVAEQTGAAPATPTPGVSGVPATFAAPSTPASVGTPTSAIRPAAPKLPADCKVALAARETLVSHAGQTVTFAASFDPAACATEPVSTVAWIKRRADSKVPRYGFDVEPNSTRTSRQGLLQVGEVSMTVKQAAGIFVPFAAAPARIEFSIGEKKPPKQTVTVWSDDRSRTFAANSRMPALKITPATQKAGTQRFTLEIAAADLKPGRYESVIEITSPGVVNDPIRIPIVVTVAEKRN